jgi:hypothetical protein
MRDRRTVLLAAGVLALLVAGCTTKTQPQMESRPQTEVSSSDAAKGESLTSANRQRVTLYVEGMTKVQGIT